MFENEQFVHTVHIFWNLYSLLYIFADSDMVLLYWVTSKSAVFTERCMYKGIKYTKMCEMYKKYIQIQQLQADISLLHT